MRHELKYQLGPGEYAALRQRLKTLMQRDRHAGPDGTYTISSLYFDDRDDSALLANYAGLSRREKFRIRRYNDDNATLHLEKKFKQGGVGTKFMCPIAPEEYERLLRGDLSWMPDSDRPLLRELYVKMRNDLLRPKTIVFYKREPFVYGPGNVRVTFDSDIRSGIVSLNMLDAQTPLVPANPGLVLMEVKYDTFVPDIISDALQEGTLRVGAYSKYAACRQNDI